MLKPLSDPHAALPSPVKDPELDERQDAEQDTKTRPISRPATHAAPQQDASSTSPLRVYVVDDDPLVLDVLGNMLRAASYDVVGYSSATSFLENLDSLPRGIVLTDQLMPDLSGLELYEQLRNHRPHDFRLILITAFPRTSLTVEAMKAGALTVLDKPISLEDLLNSLREGFIRLAATSGAAQPLPPPRHSGGSYLDLLSEREREVILMVYQGRTNKSISIELDLSIKTVEKHRARGMRKMQVTSLAGLVRLINREIDRGTFSQDLNSL